LAVPLANVLVSATNVDELAAGRVHLQHGGWYPREIRSGAGPDSVTWSP
jgi:TRAP-type mannitol/chloroaromatic compound transport system substrate-binding protein